MSSFLTMKSNFCPLNLKNRSIIGLYFLPLLVFLSSCGMSIERETYYTQDFSPAEVEEAIANRKLYASHENNFSNSRKPMALGMLMSITDSPSAPGKYRLRDCTAFMIDETTLLTNAHCVPKKVRDTEISCHGRVYFAHGASNNSYACQKVLFAHKNYTDEDFKSQTTLRDLQPDVVVLKMNPIRNVSYFELSDERMKKDEELIVHSLTPVNKNPYILYEMIYDLSRKFRVNEPDNRERVYVEIEGKEAKIVSGNSGSPILDRNKKVKGIVFGSLRRNNQFGLSVDLGCLSQSGNNWAWSDTKCPL